jgi:predicted enzyme related to lactoylglutathione lyase
MAAKLRPGRIGWIDLTVPDAAKVRDFYQAVVGWRASAVSMGGYTDFCVHAGTGKQPVAGICHARGANADLPPQWMIYVVVRDLRASLAACRKAGGSVLTRTKRVGAGRYAVIRDPAGAVAALYQTD